jgi:threonine dehydratase
VSGFLDEHAASVRGAASRIRPHVRRTPVLRTDLHPELRLKAECFQVTGSFKPPGASSP